MLQPQTMGLAGGTGMLKEQTLADVLASKDAVSGLAHFCQRYVSRPTSKEDISYQNSRLPNGHQCTVKVDCLGGLEFAGEVCSNAKEAKLSASQQVLNHFADQIASMPAVTKKPKNNNKRKSSGQLMPDATKSQRLDDSDGPKVLPPSASNKGDLNTLYCKIIRRVINKGEVIYQTGNVQGGYQSQVQLPGLPDPWDKQIWAGEVMEKKGDAEQSVAGVALATLRSEPSLMAMHDAPKKPNAWIMGGGMQRKGKGKGGFKGHQPALSSSPAPYSREVQEAYQGQSPRGFSPLL